MTKVDGALIRRIPYPLRSRVLRVVRVETLGSTMRRITLSGPDLEPDFPFVPLAAADHVKVALPDADTGVVSPGAPSTLRDYTIRAVDPDRRELTIDFVVHEHGPAGRWAATAGPGSTIGILGPRGSQVFPDWCPAYLLVADETGRPATERFLEELPREAEVSVVTIGVAEWTPLPSTGRIGHRVHVVGGSGPGVATALVETVADLPVGRDTFVWAAGETTVMRHLRNHLRDERQVDADHLVVRGYWRQGAAGPPSEQEEL